MTQASSNRVAEERDIVGAVACRIYTEHTRRRLDRDDILYWDELPPSAQARWRSIAGEVLRYLDVLLWGERPCG